MIDYRFFKGSCDSGEIFTKSHTYDEGYVFAIFEVCLEEDVQDLREETVFITILTTERGRLSNEEKTNLQERIWRDASKRKQQMK